MQDRFKFRIYCKSENKMMIFNNPTLIDGEVLKGGLLFKNYTHKITNVHEVSCDDLVLMQCTGLNDTNGKLIYEGDIVKFSSLYGHAKFEIKWNEEFATFGYEDEETDFSELGRLYNEASFVEVIGNRYENKKLLNANIQS